MAEKSYTLNFYGYWREPNISGLPEKSGIYGVYACTHDINAGKVNIKRLIYIGESKDVKARVAGHNKWEEWKGKLRAGEVICLNVAEISPEADRQRAEAAMIFQHKPTCNTEYTENFPFDLTNIETEGKNTLMDSSFSVEETEKAA